MTKYPGIEHEVGAGAIESRLRLPEMYYAKSAKPDTVTLTVLLFTLGTLLTATLNVMLG